ncbi:hypothetical protein [Campylobacter ureolyticus]|uniref:hypothetical protein n=1 Tax=Campylobacter ureolyticus TaxID=827 RepID=UPI0028893C61|nr:hypothetical protein [Campylobacter ureolyticus]
MNYNSKYQDDREFGNLVDEMVKNNPYTMEGDNYYNQTKQRAYNNSIPANSVNRYQNNPYINFNQTTAVNTNSSNNPYQDLVPKSHIGDKYGWGVTDFLQGVANTRNNLRNDALLRENHQKQRDMLNAQREFDLKNKMFNHNVEQSNINNAFRQSQADFDNSFRNKNFDYQKGIDQRDFDYNANNDYIKNMQEMQKLQDSREQNQNLLQNKRTDMFYKNMADDVFDKVDSNDYSTKKQITDYYARYGTLPSYDEKQKSFNFDNPNEQENQIDFNDIQTLNELQAKGYSFGIDENGQKVVFDRYGNRVY